MDGAAASGDNVPCSACALQDKCQALRPRALDFGPKQIFPLTRTGPKSLIVPVIMLLDVAGSILVEVSVWNMYRA